MSTVHLLVLIHGMWGNPTNVAELNRIICDVHKQAKSEPSEPGGSELEVLLAETNRDESTYDGIDWGGERVSEEIYAEVARIEGGGRKVSRLSVTGYSLGGLVARYVIGILYQRKFFDDITPVNFNTFATPHIGLIRYSSFMSSVLHKLGPKLMSRTGEQFYGVDRWSARGRPLLDVMADPNRIFYQALARFQHVRIYANAVNDITVPYVTAAIEAEDPFMDHEKNGIKIELDDKYSPIIKSYSLPASPHVPIKPALLSAEWFSSLNLTSLTLPPFLQFRFPLNILVYLCVPILVPMFITLLFIRASSATRSSRARIQLLEKDESYSNRLVHILSEVEREVEDAVDDFLEEADIQTESNGSGERNLEDLSLQAMQKPSEQQPILTGAQRARIMSLNRLPNLEKEKAFIHPVRNSHASIICRDVKNYEFHKMGEGVLRHWADHFVL